LDDSQEVVEALCDRIVRFHHTCSNGVDHEVFNDTDHDRFHCARERVHVRGKAGHLRALNHLVLTAGWKVDVLVVSIDIRASDQ
jgi:hypothetical protein